MNGGNTVGIQNDFLKTSFISYLFLVNLNVCCFCSVFVVKSSLVKCEKCGSAEYSLSNLDRVLNLLRGLLVDDFFSMQHQVSHHRNIASLSLLYHYLHSKCSHGLHFIAPPALQPKPSLLHPKVDSTYVFLSYSLRIPFISLFLSESFFPKTATLQDRFPRHMLPQTLQS